MQDYSQAAAYVAALTFGCPDDVIDWRFIHDQDAAKPAIKRRGRLADIWHEACEWNNRGYGVFCCISAMDGVGNELANVAYIRTHAVDLDNLSAPANYERACSWQLAPSFAVQTSPNKFHVYWRVNPYIGNEFYTLQQRKLRQLFDGDGSVIDASRVLRVPGFMHCKGEPRLVTCWALSGYGGLWTAEHLQVALAHVNVIEGGSGERKPLGDPDMAGPSLDWCKYALSNADPNNMSRAEWISFTAAWKQAAWSHADADTLFNIWSEWCARYSANDTGENLKQWNDLRKTAVGWKYILNQIPSLKALIAFGGKQHAQPSDVMETGPANHATAPPPPGMDCSGEYLTEIEQREWFKDCFFIGRMGQILSRDGRFMNSTQFNGVYGGKKFIIDSEAKVTDEPWKAALRSTLWTIPKVDHIRFLPDQPTFAIIEDQLGRKGVNTYLPIRIVQAPGDVSPWLNHLSHMIPDDTDRKHFIEYLAHNIKYPGYKIPWAPMIQSTEGVGKGFIQETVEEILGKMYTYSPKAEELVKSGSTFNGWMRGKLMIIVNEIKVDERRELVEILKPMISDKRVEIQSKGVDQEMEDNPANWLFFSNYKDAIPVGQNGRRYAIFYSAIQSNHDLQARGLDDAYFNRLFGWLRNGNGASHMAHYLLNYPIERGAIPMRAPETSSMPEARRISRTPQEQAILHAVEDTVQGFRGGWISSVAAVKRLKQDGLRVPSPQALGQILTRLGYHQIGRAARAYVLDDPQARSDLYHMQTGADVAHYAVAQGYE